MITKNKQFDELINAMANCQKCLFLQKRNGQDCSLVNIYQNQKFCKNIPSIWTDWYNRLDTKIMIIGQDWGPYNDMDKFHELYMEEPTKENWNQIMEKEKSLTKKMLTSFLKESASYYGITIDMHNVYITNAIMCARKGDTYRGDNIKLKESSLNCSNFLKRQIEIVKPKIILTLGYYPLLSLSKIFEFPIETSLTKTIEKYSVIKTSDYVIIPLYHPTAQVKKEVQLEQYKKIWI